MLLSKCKYS